MENEDTLVVIGEAEARRPGPQLIVTLAGVALLHCYSVALGFDSWFD